MARSWLMIWAVDARFVLLDSMTNVAALVVPLLIATMASYCPGASATSARQAGGRLASKVETALAIGDRRPANHRRVEPDRSEDLFDRLRGPALDGGLGAH